MTHPIPTYLAALAAGVLLAPLAQAGVVVPSTLVLDFDTDANGQPIVHGQVIDDEYAAWGVQIDVQHPSQSALDFGVALGTAVSIEADMRTDEANGAYHPTNDTFLGNVLIAPRNGVDANNDDILDVPDTAYERPNGVFTFSFGEATYLSGMLTVLDAEEAGGSIETYLNGGLVGTVGIPALGDNAVVTIGLPQGEFDKIVVRLAGSGGLNDVTVNPVPEPAAATLLAGATLLGLRRRK